MGTNIPAKVFPYRHCFELRKERSSKTGAEIAKGLVETLPMAQKAQRVLEENFDFSQCTTTEELLAVVEQAFLKAHGFVYGHSNVSLWNLYQALVNSHLLTLNLPASLSKEEKNSFCLKLLGWQPVGEVRNSIIMTRQAGEQGSKLCQQLGIKAGQEVLSIGHGHHVSLEINAALCGAHVIGSDTAEQPFTSNNGALEKNPVISIAIDQMGGSLRFQREIPTLCEVKTEGNLVTLVGVIDDPGFFDRHNGGIAKAEELVSKALEYVGPKGSFLFGVTYIMPGSIFATIPEYFELVIQTMRNNGYQFQAGKDIQDGRSLRVWQELKAPNA